MSHDLEAWIESQSAKSASRQLRLHGLGGADEDACRAQLESQFRALAPVMSALWDHGYDVSEPYELRTNRFYRLPNNARSVLPLLIEYVPTTEDENAQKELVSTISHLGGAGRFKGMTESIISMISDPRTSAVQEELANCIATFAGDSDFDAVVELINNPFGPRDWGLAEALGRMSTRLVESPLRDLLEDEAANEAASRFKGGDAAKLAAELAAVEEVEFRRRVLGDVSNSALVDLAIPVATENHVFGQGGALVAVRKLKLEPLAGLVEGFVDHPMTRVRREARKTMKRLSTL